MTAVRGPALSTSIHNEAMQPTPKMLEVANLVAKALEIKGSPYAQSKVSLLASFLKYASEGKRADITQTKSTIFTLVGWCTRETIERYAELCGYTLDCVTLPAYTIEAKEEPLKTYDKTVLTVTILRGIKPFM